MSARPPQDYSCTIRFGAAGFSKLWPVREVRAPYAQSVSATPLFPGLLALTITETVQRTYILLVHSLSGERSLRGWHIPSIRQIVPCVPCCKANAQVRGLAQGRQKTPEARPRSLRRTWPRNRWSGLAVGDSPIRLATCLRKHRDSVAVTLSRSQKKRPLQYRDKKAAVIGLSCTT